MCTRPVILLIFAASAGSFLADPLCALPAIRPGSVVNAASFKPSVVPGSGLAQGSLASAFGSGLGPATGVAVSAFPLSTTLSGVTVRLTRGTSSVDAYPVFVRQDQVNFIVPSTASVGTNELRITYNGEISVAETVEVVVSAFGLFTFAEGSQRAVVQNFVSSTETPVNLPAAAARPGQTLIAYGTGLGAIAAPDNLMAPVGNLPGASVEVLAGGVPARLTYAGRSSCCAGLDQLVFELAGNTPEGCTVPLVVRSGSIYSNVGNISVARTGTACSDLGISGGEPVVCGSGSGGAFTIAELFTETPVQNLVTGYQNGYFLRASGCILAAPVPVNTCLVGTTVILPGAPPAIPPDQPAPPQPDLTLRFLDAGPILTLNGPGGERQILRRTGNVYSGATYSGTTPSLTAGSYTFAGSGGEDVGSFSHRFDFAPIRLTSPIKSSRVDLNQPMTITWSGGEYARDLLYLGLTLIDTDVAPSSRTIVTGIVCSIRGGRGESFRIPDYIWAQVPDTHGRRPTSAAGLFGIGGSFLSPIRFNAPGLDNGVSLNLFTSHSIVLSTSR